MLYGETNIVYNIHNLIHLSHDVKIYGSLDTFSAFPFENHMRILKRMLRKSLKCTHSHKKIKFKYFMLSAKCPDNCCYLKDGSVFCIKYIGFKDNVPVVLGNKYIDLRPVAAYPCNSQIMDIHMSNGQTLDLL